VRELTFVKAHRVEWRSVPEPQLRGPDEALVRPVIAARCDGDNLPLFNRLTTAMSAGIALHYLDPLTSELLGPYPYGKPFAIGHECIGEVVQCGDRVRLFRAGQLVVVPWAISCGGCRNCTRGLTSRCSAAGGTLLSAYGFGAAMGNWGGAVSDLLRVPFADAMLVAVPETMDPIKLASASDNMPDAWRAVGPALAKRPGECVLVVGGGARSIGLYAAGMAVALGSVRVDYLDHNPERLRIAESLGANPVETRRGAGWFARHAPGA
jgi:threonine dehydrogenase-like Zn-dependent dehydrogenase